MNQQLSFLYLHSEKIGYGHAGLRLHEALSDLGVDVYDGLPGSGDLDLAGKRSKICRDVLFLTIPTHITGWYREQRAHLFTMWEATELPEAMRETLHNFETILVPSEANVELYSKYHDNVKFVPLGVDTERWSFQQRRPTEPYFNFLIGGSGKRKGTDLVHQAFMELFGDFNRNSAGPIPRLLMKNPKGEDFGGRNVEVISGYMSPEDEVELYASAHCYVQPSRGEGWGMQPLQAIAQGLPTILTGAHGHAAFAEHGLAVPAAKQTASYLSMFGESGDWWEPDYNVLKAYMLHVYQNYDEAQHRAAVASARVHDEFTWERSAQAVVSAIGSERLAERFRFPDLPTEFFSPDAKLFRTIVTRDWTADIAGIVHFFKRGEEYWKPADVKRVLFEADVLDPACISDGDGLTASQLERLGTYIEDHSHCPTCGQIVAEEEAV